MNGWVPLSVIEYHLMKRQPYPSGAALAFQYLAAKEKIGGECSGVLHSVSRMSGELGAYCKAMGELVADLAKRVMIFQLKNAEYFKRLSMFQSPQGIQDRFEKIVPLQRSLLGQLVQACQQKVNFMDDNFNGFEYEQDFADDFGSGVGGDLVKQQLQQPQPLMQQYDFAASMPESVAKKKQVKKMRPKKQPEPPHFFSKKSKGDVGRGSYQIDGNHVGDEDVDEFGGRIEISLEDDVVEQRRRVREMKEKEERRFRVREEFKVVSQFVQNYLRHRLRYEDDHKQFTIPKKLLLSLYLGWCKERDRKVLLSKPSTIQMALTNEIKIAFPGVDVYTSNYRGLRFAKGNDASHEQRTKHHEQRAELRNQQAKQLVKTERVDKMHELNAQQE